jgi:hypothetical protein
MARKKCDHLNAESRSVSGVSMIFCRDCGTTIDPSLFEPKEARNAQVPLPPPDPADRDAEGLVRVLDTLVSGLVKLPGLEDPFFPLTGVKKGDLIVVLRKASRKPADAPAAPETAPGPTPTP